VGRVHLSTVGAIDRASSHADGIRPPGDAGAAARALGASDETVRQAMLSRSRTGGGAVLGKMAQCAREGNDGYCSAYTS
jgi:hypothetical protein